MKAMDMGRFAAMNMIYNRHSFGYFLDSMERLGVSNFELWTGAPHPNNFVPSLRDTQALGKELRRRGLNVVCLTPEQCLYPQNIAVRNDELRALSVPLLPGLPGHGLGTGHRQNALLCRLGRPR